MDNKYFISYICSFLFNCFPYDYTARNTVRKNRNLSAVLERISIVGLIWIYIKNINRVCFLCSSLCLGWYSLYEITFSNKKQFLDFSELISSLLTPFFLNLPISCIRYKPSSLLLKNPMSESSWCWHFECICILLTRSWIPWE